jgi:hypothetical protein
MLFKLTAPLGQNGKQMSRSNRKSSTTRSTTASRDGSANSRTRTTSTPQVDGRTSSHTNRVTETRRLRYYTFQYNRDDVAHGRGSNSVRITDRSSNGTVELTLQEARSLYRLLDGHFSG